MFASTPAEIANALTVVGSAVGLLLAGAAYWIFRLGHQVGRLRGQVETEKDLNDKDRTLLNTIALFHQRKGFVAAVNRGMVDNSGPTYQLTEEWRERLEPLKKVLQHWYLKEGFRQDDEGKLFWAIERKFGEKILQEVCLPHNLQNAECLVAAVLLCRESMMIRSVSIQHK